MGNAIYLSVEGQLYHFISLWIQNSDGSLYIGLGESKLKRISYHSTGRVNYHNFNNTKPDPIYLDPLYRTTSANYFFRLVVGDAEKLDPFYGGIEKEDFILDMDEFDNPICFDFVIAPWNSIVEKSGASIRYRDLFALVILYSKFIVSPPEKAESISILQGFPRLENISRKQSIDKHAALIDFHKRLTKFNGQILYFRNTDGIYKLIFNTPKLIAPRVEIKFTDHQYSAEIIDCTESITRFKVKDKFGQTVKREVEISGIFLDARP